MTNNAIENLRNLTPFSEDNGRMFASLDRNTGLYFVYSDGIYIGHANIYSKTFKLSESALYAVSDKVREDVATVSKAWGF